MTGVIFYTKQDVIDFIQNKMKEIILTQVVYFLIFGERDWKILIGKTKLLNNDRK
jgi:hypothetical protein